MKQSNAAVVVGICSHGLSICRALNQLGVQVYALDKNMELPGKLTNSAELIEVEDINSDKLVDALIDLATKFIGEPKPVLFPTNDKMVEIFARNWATLAPLYLLSWSEHCELVRKLHYKDEIEKQSTKTGVSHPKSFILQDTSDLSDISADKFPLIVKPTRPMSSFKVELVDDIQSLQEVCHEHTEAMPFIAQQFIEGDDERLVFCSMFMKNGQALVKFLGRKLQSYPVGLGQGTIMEPYFDSQLVTLSEQYFEGTNYTGPVSIEFKIDDQGVYWLIEPNIGRTEFSVECARANNVDLVKAEYLATIGGDLSQVGEQTYERVWLDTEKDVTVYFRLIKQRKSFWINGKLPVFPYLALHDMKPFFSSFFKSLRTVGGKILKIMKLK